MLVKSSLRSVPDRISKFFIKGKEAKTTLDINKDIPMIGIVTSRECPTCGHHEVGVTTKDGTFHSLKPGTLIQTMDAFPAQGPGLEETQALSKGTTQEAETQAEYRHWAPDPVKGDRSLRLKYGVLVNEESGLTQMNGQIFQAAYLDKLRRLIEKEIYMPIAVILDRFFLAAHLASGSPEEIAFAMWNELDEIRGPVDLVKDWLDDPNKEHLSNLIQPKSSEDIAGDYPGEGELKEELEQLSLEEFLSLF